MKNVKVAYTAMIFYVRGLGFNLIIMHCDRVQDYLLDHLNLMTKYDGIKQAKMTNICSVDRLNGHKY